MSMLTIQSLRNAQGSPIPHTMVSRPEYTNWREEQMSSKETVCIGNWSFVPAVYIKGSGALQLLKDYAINSFEKFAIGTVR